MTTEKITIENVTLDEADLKSAVVLLLREKGYQHIKVEDIIINPTTVTAQCSIQNTNKTT